MSTNKVKLFAALSDKHSAIIFVYFYIQFARRRYRIKTGQPALPQKLLSVYRLLNFACLHDSV
jgi:hypothetical protein